MWNRYFKDKVKLFKTENDLKNDWIIDETQWNYSETIKEL